ncbi:hypothetical protein HYZ82_02120 [Candidatus Nomurabacteria bacterium]|nr:hypothetical protein [Candidatus Nomurabacteria bacterium]
MAKEAKENPGKFASGQASDFFMDLLFLPAILTLSSLIILFTLGFTDFPSFLGGPYFFFKVLFFLLLTAVIFMAYFLRKIHKLIKSVTKNTMDRTIEVKSKILE